MPNPKKRNPVQIALARTGLYHEYQRMTALDPRVAPLMARLLPHADFREPGDDETLLIRTLREATERVRWHFKYTDPNIAAGQARTEYWEYLTRLSQRLLGPGQENPHGG